jgi:hypothetical protein
MTLIYVTNSINELRWKEDYYFPCRPKIKTTDPLEEYLNNLKVSAVLAYNDRSPKLLIHKFFKTQNNSILVMCEREGRMCERKGFHPWLIIKITIDNATFVESKTGSYFEKEDAEKAFDSRIDQA